MSEILSFEVNDHFFVSVKMINMMIGTKFESQSKILSGFRMPFGSRVRLMERITFTVSGPNSKSRYCYIMKWNEFQSLQFEHNSLLRLDWCDWVHGTKQKQKQKQIPFFQRRSRVLLYKSLPYLLLVWLYTRITKYERGDTISRHEWVNKEEWNSEHTQTVVKLFGSFKFIGIFRINQHEKMKISCSNNNWFRDHYVNDKIWIKLCLRELFWIHHLAYHHQHVQWWELQDWIWQCLLLFFPNIQQVDWLEHKHLLSWFQPEHQVEGLDSTKEPLFVHAIFLLFPFCNPMKKMKMVKFSNKNLMILFEIIKYTDFVTLSITKSSALVLFRNFDNGFDLFIDFIFCSTEFKQQSRSLFQIQIFICVHSPNTHFI